MCLWELTNASTMIEGKPYLCLQHQTWHDQAIRCKYLDRMLRTLRAEQWSTFMWHRRKSRPSTLKSNTMRISFTALKSRTHQKMGRRRSPPYAWNLDRDYVGMLLSSAVDLCRHDVYHHAFAFPCFIVSCRSRWSKRMASCVKTREEDLKRRKRFRGWRQSWNNCKKSKIKEQASGDESCIVRANRAFQRAEEIRGVSASDSNLVQITPALIFSFSDGHSFLLPLFITYKHTSVS